ncbi:hypothetical protein MtrunA17_Chr7g0239411 [Medicago truncatula]|uniref:Uncharacterized protein n=1 Tax=Medicago truncatula TaxID=3880 RepID=A0A396H133_MEDTR|nr:hypothetical protein MtrunA17_Chr7g0239411 [Medicago truncatula]
MQVVEEKATKNKVFKITIGNINDSFTFFDITVLEGRSRTQ